MKRYAVEIRDSQIPWLSLLSSVILAPIGIALNARHSSDMAVFISNLLALVPLSTLLKHCIKDIVWWLQLKPLRLHGHLAGGLVDCILG
jgi:hypothetical protein